MNAEKLFAQLAQVAAQRISDPSISWELRRIAQAAAHMPITERDAHAGYAQLAWVTERDDPKVVARRKVCALILPLFGPRAYKLDTWASAVPLGRLLRVASNQLAESTDERDRSLSAVLSRESAELDPQS